jgi:uncharacterized membrane protein YdjX (TVP38/TMEM64 family)
LNKHQFHRITKLVLIISIVAITIVLAKHFGIKQLVRTSLLWVESLGAIAPIAFIVIYNLATLLFVPGSLLTISGGSIFGWGWGCVYVAIAAVIGAILSFLLGRYLSRDWVIRQVGQNPKFQAIDRAVAIDGWKIVLLTRLSPIFPFNLLNYAFGISQVNLRDYILGSIGMIPGIVMYVYLGSLVTDLTTIEMSDFTTKPETQIVQWIVRAIGAIATIAVTIYGSHLAKKALSE